VIKIGDECVFCRHDATKGDTHSACWMLHNARGIGLRAMIDSVQDGYQMPPLLDPVDQSIETGRSEAKIAANPIPLLWAIVHQGTISKLGHGCITCPVCSFRVVAAQGCTHLTCPGCSTPICRQCGGVHRYGDPKSDFCLSAGCMQLMSRAGMPVALPMACPEVPSWFAHNSGAQVTSPMRAKARAVTMQCFVDESQAEVYDEIQDDDVVRLVHPAYRLESFFPVELQPSVQAARAVAIGEERRSAENQTWAKLLQRIRTVVRIAGLGMAFLEGGVSGILRPENRDLKKALLRIWPSPSLYHLPGKLAGLLALSMQTWGDEESHTTATFRHSDDRMSYLLLLVRQDPRSMAHMTWSTEWNDQDHVCLDDLYLTRRCDTTKWKIVEGNQTDRLVKTWKPDQDDKGSAGSSDLRGV